MTLKFNNSTASISANAVQTRILAANSLFLLTAGLCLVTNTIVYVIYHKHGLRSKCWRLMAQLAIADWLVGMAYFATAIKRIVR